MKNAVLICLSPSVILPASVMMFDDVSWCFCPYLRVVNLSLSVSSVLPFHQSVPFLCLSVTRPNSSSCSSLSPFSYHMSKSVIYHVAKFVIHPHPKHSWHSLSLYCTEPVLTQQFYMQQSNATPWQALPLVEVCLNFLSRKN